MSLRLKSLAAALFCAAAFLLPGAASAADASMPPFPALSGPVVDEAGLLSGSTRAELDRKLRAFAENSGDQLVVVTVPTLDGYPIEYWGYELGRHWGIGAKDKNTGVLLIVDRDERKVRIEVGYGLEGTLTDALSDDIIRNTILPRFKQGDYDGGISAGVDAIQQVLGGHADEVRHAKRKDGMSTLFLIVFIFFILLNVLRAGFGGRTGGRLFWLWWLLGGMNSGRGRSGWGGGGLGGGGFGGGGFGGGGGFSGGGGSFGGGGASGSW
ncbi:MAG TPA: TPM domain-containing protein [Gammaproteobacteria bacterium]